MEETTRQMRTNLFIVLALLNIWDFVWSYHYIVVTSTCSEGNVWIAYLIDKDLYWLLAVIKSGFLYILWTLTARVSENKAIYALTLPIVFYSMLVLYQLILSWKL